VERPRLGDSWIAGGGKGESNYGDSPAEPMAADTKAEAGAGPGTRGGDEIAQAVAHGGGSPNPAAGDLRGKVDGIDAGMAGIGERFEGVPNYLKQLRVTGNRSPIHSPYLSVRKFFASLPLRRHLCLEAAAINRVSGIYA